MSFRIEEKMLFHASDLFKIKDFIVKNKGINLYPDRSIESIYFDNKFLQSYKESEEGILPRKKIRIRSYDQFKTSFLEEKISSVEGKFKKNSKISSHELHDFKKEGYFDKKYGLMYPIIKISYLRSYYLIEKKIRITMDRNILYNSINNKTLFFRDSDILILETKLNSRFILSDLENLIPFTRLRVSKYCQSIDKLFGKNCHYKLNYNF